jgi:putative ABC transport system substrate-binding protein
MRRRELITLLGGAVMLPRIAHAQSSSRILRIGFLGITIASSWASRLEALRSGLRDLGYEPEKNVVIEDLWAEEQYDRLPALVSELVRRKVDIILTYGTPGTLAAKQATTDIPVIFVYAGDAVAAGLVASLSRPEANVTGQTYFLPELMTKRLELLKDVIPHITRVGVLVKPDNPLFKATLPVLQSAADILKIELEQFIAQGPTEFEPAIAEMTKNRVEGIVVQEDAVYLTNSKKIIELATKQSLPVASSGEFGEAGALIAYGVDFHDMCRRAALFVDKIVRGAKPRELPIERATKFETVINLRAAKTLGLSIPPLALLRATVSLNDNVRYWHKTDIAPAIADVFILGMKQTWSGRCSDRLNPPPDPDIGSPRHGPIVCSFLTRCSSRSARLPTSIRRFLRGPNETARVHYAYQRRGGVAGSGGGAAARENTPHWHAHAGVNQFASDAVVRRISECTSRSRLE